MRTVSLLVCLCLGLSACVVVPSGGYGKKSGGGATVLLCHKGKKTMELPREAASGHIGHGDRYGPC
jgi:starvation-inducible outer membrane lipoprotein